MENFGKFVVGLLTVIISPIIKGFVVMKMWMWFIVPVFELEPLRLVEAIGIMLLVKFVGFKSIKLGREISLKQLGTTMLVLVSISAFALLSGWIVQSFM